MKPRTTALLVAIPAGALGFLAGISWKRERNVPEEPAYHAGRNRPANISPPVTVKTGSGRSASGAQDATVDRFAHFNTEAAALPPEQFGQRYAELLTSADSADALLERAAMLAAIDSDRAVACYLAYKKRVGAPLQQNSQEIRHLLTVAGEREGGKIVAAMQQAAPGFQELSSIIHGWAMKEPAAAVEWYNKLPDADGQRKASLDGLMWGLSQRDASTARTVFHALSPEDQLTSGRSLGRALFTANGGAELDRLIEGLPPEAAQQCLAGACERSYRRTPAETVPWLAAHLGTTVTVDQTFVHTWSRWTASDPASAEQWRLAAILSNPRIAPLLEAPVEDIPR